MHVTDLHTDKQNHVKSRRVNHSSEWDEPAAKVKPRSTGTRKQKQREKVNVVNGSLLSSFPQFFVCLCVGVNIHFTVLLWQSETYFIVSVFWRNLLGCRDTFLSIDPHFDLLVLHVYASAHFIFFTDSSQWCIRPWQFGPPPSNSNKICHLLLDPQLSWARRWSINLPSVTEHTSLAICAQTVAMPCTRTSEMVEHGKERDALSALLPCLQRLFPGSICWSSDTIPSEDTHFCNKDLHEFHSLCSKRWTA